MLVQFEAEAFRSSAFRLLFWAGKLELELALPEKSFGRYRFGYAAGYEARLCRAVQIRFGSGLRPRFGLCPAVYWPKAEPGA